eukprot:m.26369 g.26369  ORF g.26369 m.26369 type:complete len:207 (+) comp29285_c0_seq1:220-840(+)
MSCKVCKNRHRSKKDLNWHTLPKNPVQRRTWLHRLKLQEEDVTHHTRVCSEHFESEMYEEIPRIVSELKCGPIQRRLKSSALPNFIGRPLPKRRQTGAARKEWEKQDEKKRYLKSIYASMAEGSSTATVADIESSEEPTDDIDRRDAYSDDASETSHDTSPSSHPLDTVHSGLPLLAPSVVTVGIQCDTSSFEDKRDVGIQCDPGL